MLNEDLLTAAVPASDIDHARLVSAFSEDLLAAARAAQNFAYAPYSNFAVGAAVLLSDGTIYRGANVENASFGLTVCAERVALFNAVSEGRIDIAAVALVTSSLNLLKPCGACRQVIAEFSKADNPIIIISTTASGLTATEPITALLPDSFTLL
jgi:cytidine deaminase